MKPNIHPELYRAMQAARQEEISRGAARRRPEDHRDRNGWVVRRGRMVTFFELRSEMRQRPAWTRRRANEHPCERSSTRRQPSAFQ